MTSASSTSASSRVVRGSSLIACWSEGVRMRRWDSLCDSPSFWCMATAQAPGMGRRRATPASALNGVELEAFPEVHAPYIGVGSEREWRPTAKYMPVPENIGPIRYFQGLSDVMVGYEDADTAPFEVRDDPLYVDDGYGVDPREGLVEEDERGRGRERSTNFEPPPFTPRE